MGNNIVRTLRISRGWTQEELGKKMGVQKAAVNKWETGQLDLKRSTIQRLCEIFDVSPLEFFTSYENKDRGN